MKRLLLSAFAGSAFLLSSCSTTQLAQQDTSDDVYYTSAKAKEVIPAPAVEQTARNEKNYRTDEQLYGGNDYSDEDYYEEDYYNYDYGYASRLNRFYGRSTWRPYYDSWYTYSYYPWYTYRYDPFFYDPWAYRPGASLWVGIGTFQRWGLYDNYYGSFYGYPYGSRYWGPYSYYNTYPGYGYGGYYGGGYYAGRAYNNPNYRPRPNRESGVGRGTGAYYPNNGRPNVSGVYGGRPGRTSGGVAGTDRTSSRPDGNTSSQPTTRPSRPSRSDDSYSTPRGGTSTSGESRPAEATRPSRPSRSSDSGTSRGTSTREQSRPAESSRPARTERTYSPPPSYDSGRSSSGGSSSGGSSSGGGGSSSSGRPSRGGR